MKNFCCESFKYRVSGDNGMGLNIRVLKMTKEFVERGLLKFDKSFMMTDGYTSDIFESKYAIIEYCPFCGTHLRSFYKSDDYVQETIDVPKR